MPCHARHDNINNSFIFKCLLSSSFTEKTNCEIIIINLNIFKVVGTELFIINSLNNVPGDGSCPSRSDSVPTQNYSPGTVSAADTFGVVCPACLRDFGINMILFVF